ncbi:putative NBD/HSP70 family sugar kinase [Lacibacter cauensis]|uniref:Putative NBD/HSP70 family sugar kinase n=1 Tax=Lacibacter cauensis TaxID=510947 RepID=A0A562SH38_9BACT|nr:ROK family protein [Lacibacter cauensis]TWI80579.1 putative NBD/HSP70 family sugar kinase [Lacibacter cauensis]
MLPKNSRYKRQIQKHLYFEKELSCADLSLLTDKSLPLTTRVLNELIEEGAVVESGYAHSTGGRRPLVYSLKADMLYVVSVAMDQLVTRIAILDMQNNYVHEPLRIELPLSNNAAALTQLTQYINQYILSSGISKEKIAGIGIGMPGFVDVTKGINHSFLKTESGNSIVTVVESAVGVPVFIDNDSSLIALAELKFGAARNKQTVMVVNVGWGIGLGMIVKGELFRGNNGFAGEFSHLPLFTNNKLCSCGKSGCLETESSLFIVAEKAIKGLKEGRASILKNLTLEHAEDSSRKIMEAASKGDMYAIELLSEAGYHIGRGISILIHLFNPELIVLSGRGSVGGKIWLAPIQQAINEHCIPKIAENTHLEISSLGFQAELIGAAALVMDHFDMLDRRKTKNAGSEVEL